MKLIGRLFLTVFLFIIATIVFGLGYMGYIPTIANLLGTNKPKDLGIRFTEQDRVEAHAKSGVEYGTLPATTSDELSIQRFGKHNVDTIWTSAQASALMNNRPWKFWPYQNVQVKFNADGSAEVSGGLNKAVVPNYAAAIGIPKVAVEFAMKLLPPNPVFYLKMKASLKDNQIETFEPQTFQLNQIPLPVNAFLSFNPRLIGEVNAQFSANMLSDLVKVKNKRSLIIGYINDRLSGYSSFFYAKESRILENKLIYKGTLADQEATVR
ncbi:MAG: hypothetical protein US48_C0017G0009 [Candidatus Levybacteria bacterium GW2011_GWA2_37_36]|nr:MAG: hypothetical protein US48_C0017G0009 [Candidatus Levybacteria bacterium GW2011_GWA2_37_36]